MLRKIVLYLVLILVLFIGLLFAIPYFFKGQIVDYAKEQLNEQLNAKVDFKDVNLSLIRNFPKLRASLDDLLIIGEGPFANDTLANIDELALTMPLRNIISQDPIEILGINVVRPIIKAKVLKDGKANWDITKPSPAGTEAEASSYNIKIKEYSVSNGEIIYEDLASNMFMSMKDIDHEGAGDFTQDIFDLATQTDIAQMSFLFDGIKYLNKVKVDAKADFAIDNNKNQYTFKQNDIKLNNLALGFAGSVALLRDAYKMNMRFDAKESSLKNFISILPAAYTKDFDDVKAEGQMAFNGKVNGVYSDSSYPAFDVNLNIDNGNIKYPSLPNSIDKVNVKAKIENSDGILDNTVVDIRPLTFEIDNAPFDMQMLIKTPMSDPDVDMIAKGKLDLAQLAQSYPVEGVSKLAGLMDVDVKAKAKMSAIEKERYSDVMMDGYLKMENVEVEGEITPLPLSLKALDMTFSPQKANVNQMDGQIGTSDFDIKGSLENLLPYYLGEGTLKGSVMLNSNSLDMNEYLTGEASTEESSAPLEAIEVPKDLDLALVGNAGVVYYDDLQLNNVKGSLTIKDGALTFNDVKTNIFDGQIVMNGAYDTSEGVEAPAVNFKYAVQSLNIQKAFEKLNTIQMLAPVCKFIDGTFNTELAMDGVLGKDLSPQWMTWSGNGLLAVLKGAIKGFAPLEKLAEELKIKALDNISLQDMKTWFKFKDGRVEVGPFEIVKDNIKMAVAGSHGIDQSLDYKIFAAIPKDKMGKQASAMVDNLASQAKAQGISLKVPDFINVAIDVQGTITQPKIKLNYEDAFNNAKQSLMQMAQAYADSLKGEVTQRVEKEVEELKNKATEKVEEELDKAKEQLEAKKQALEDQAKEELEKQKAKAKKELEDKAKKEAEKLKKEAEKKLKDEAKKKAEDAAQKAKDKVKDEVEDNIKDKAKDALKDMFKKPK